VTGYHGRSGTFRLSYRLSDEEATPSGDDDLESPFDDSDDLEDEDDEAADEREGTPTSLRLTTRWQSVEGVFRTLGADRSFEFEGEASGEVIFSTSPCTGPGNADFDTLLLLRGPSGECVAEDDDSGLAETSVLRATLPETGRYRLELMSLSDGVLEGTPQHYRLAYRRRRRTARPR